MPGLVRLDAPGVLHHVMGRGIERRKIFLSDTDRNDFIGRLSALAQDDSIEIYAMTTFDLIKKRGGERRLPSRHKRYSSTQDALKTGNWHARQVSDGFLKEKKKALRRHRRPTRH